MNAERALSDQEATDSQVAQSVSHSMHYSTGEASAFSW